MRVQEEAKEGRVAGIHGDELDPNPGGVDQQAPEGDAG